MNKVKYKATIIIPTYKQVFDCDSKQIENIIQDKNNKNIYFLIGRDYLVTSCTGVFLSRIILKDDDIEFDKNAIELESNAIYSIQGGVLYGKHPLVIEMGNADGTQVNVKEMSGDSPLNLYLTEDNTFKG